MKDIKVVVEKMTRNRRKVIGKPGDSLLCRLHSIQLSSLVYSFLYGLKMFFNVINIKGVLKALWPLCSTLNS